MKRFIIVLLAIVLMMSVLTGCADMDGMRQSDRVSSNLSKEADNFNVARLITVFNCRTDTILFTATGNFSIEHQSDGDLTITGQDNDGTFYKHFVYLSRDISYSVTQLETTVVERHKFTINYNPDMIQPFAFANID